MNTSARLFVLATLFALGVACWSGLGSIAQEKGKEDKPKEKGVDAPKLKKPAGVKWEYKVVLLRDEGFEATEKQLNKLGEEGWEIVGTHVVSNVVRVIFKRPKQ